MYLNKRGVSIVELVVSVALVAVIMLFMYRLIDDVTYLKDSDALASLNQEQRVIMVSKIEEIIRSDVRVNNIETRQNFIFFKHNSETIYHLYVLDTSVNLYDSINNKYLEKWKIKGGSVKAYPTCVSEELDDIKLYNCNVPIYTNSKINSTYKVDMGTHTNIPINNNNTLDDLNLSFLLYQGSTGSLSSTVEITANVTAEGCSEPTVTLQGVGSKNGTSVSFVVDQEASTRTLEASCDGFESQTKTVSLNSDGTYDFVLSKDNVRIEFNFTGTGITTSDNPQITIDGMTYYPTSLNFYLLKPKGSAYNYSATCDSCDTTTGYVTFDTNKTVNIALSKTNVTVTFMITGGVSVANSPKITITGAGTYNDVLSAYVTRPKNTSLSYSATCAVCNTVSGTTVFDTNKTVTIPLTKSSTDVSVNVSLQGISNSDNPRFKLDGTTYYSIFNSITKPRGATYTYTATCNGCVPVSGSITFNTNGEIITINMTKASTNKGYWFDTSKKYDKYSTPSYVYPSLSSLGHKVFAYYGVNSTLPYEHSVGAIINSLGGTVQLKQPYTQYGTYDPTAPFGTVPFWDAFEAILGTYHCHAGDGWYYSCYNDDVYLSPGVSYFIECGIVITQNYALFCSVSNKSTNVTETAYVDQDGNAWCTNKNIWGH